MDATQHSNIVSFIWGIADDVLRAAEWIVNLGAEPAAGHHR